MVFTAPAPHSNTVGENAFNVSPVERGHGGWWWVVEHLPAWVYPESKGVAVLSSPVVHPQEFGAVHSLHSSPIDGQMWVLGAKSLEAENNPHGFADIQQEVVVSAPRDQKSNLFPIVTFVARGDKTQQSFFFTWDNSLSLALPVSKSLFSKVSNNAHYPILVAYLRDVPRNSVVLWTICCSLIEPTLEFESVLQC